MPSPAIAEAASSASRPRGATPFRTTKTGVPVVCTRSKLVETASISRIAGQQGIKIKSEAFAASRAVLSEWGAVSRITRAPSGPSASSTWAST